MTEVFYLIMRLSVVSELPGHEIDVLGYTVKREECEQTFDRINHAFPGYYDWHVCQQWLVENGEDRRRRLMRENEMLKELRK